MKRLRALVLLGWHLLLHIIKKATLLYRRRGLEHYRDHFNREGLFTLTTEQRRTLARGQRCIGCKMCDAVPPESTPKDDTLPAPSTIPMCEIRDLSDRDSSRESAEKIAEHYDRQALQAACPRDIDIVGLAELLTDDSAPEAGNTSEVRDT